MYIYLYISAKIYSFMCIYMYQNLRVTYVHTCFSRVTAAVLTDICDNDYNS